MENFENDELRQENPYESQQDSQPDPVPPENDPAQPRQAQPYSGAGTGRKESPFANSPYVMNREGASYQQPRQEADITPPPVPPRQPKNRKKRGGKVWKGILAAVLALVVTAAGCGLTALTVNNRWESRTAQMEQRFNDRLAALQKQVDESAQSVPGSNHTGSAAKPVDAAGGMSAGQVYAQNAQSVVLITCKVTQTAYGQTAVGTSAGSGFILTDNGYVITNHHVVEGASSVTVCTYDGTEYAAQVVGSDATNDVAVLKVEAEGLPAVKIGSSSDLAVGDQVVAIGNPLGELTSTLTVGYVSAKDRDVTTDDTILNMIQTDVAINSGNSGGPLFNMKGEVVGITTAKYSGESSSGASIEGIGFAIPIDDVIPLVDDLMNYGYITGAYLGVMVTNMDAESAAYYNMPVGVYVEEVTPGYAAEAAGVQAKDIIVGLGEYEISNRTELTRALRNFRAGDTTTITVYRSGGRLTLDITLDEKPQDTESGTLQPEMPNPDEMPENGSYDEWYKYFFPFFKRNG